MDLRARLKVNKKPIEPIVEPLTQLEDDAPSDCDDLKTDIAPEQEAESIEHSSLDDYLSAHEQKYRTEVLNKVLEAIDLSRIGKMDEEEARKQIQSLAQTVITEQNIPLSVESRKKITQLVEDEILGLGPLEFLMRDMSISEVMVNGSRTIFVEKNGRLQKSSVIFDDDAHAMRIIDRIVSRVGRRVDESSPMADARLEDGSRVNIIIPPLALDGPVVTIRRFPSDPLTLTSMVEKMALSPAMAEFLKAIVMVGKNILISGGTGSGKTTSLNALSAYIPNSERIVTIEDAAELQLQQSHIVRLETRPANVEGKGEISQRELVKNALRMRPDRIVVGEVRGAEAMDMLQAMNTGHDGSLTTTHANTPRDALSRIENMVAMSGFELPAKAVRSQIASAIHYVVQVQRLEDGSRRMTNISEINGMEGDVITMSEIFTFERKGVDAENRVIGAFKPSGAVPACMDELRRRGVKLDVDFFDPGNEVSV